MTVATDMVLLRGRGLEADFSVWLETDDGTWLDINLPAPVNAGDYWACLLSAPSVTTRTQDDLGIAVTSVSDLALDNGPWRDARAGFWDTALPLTLRGKTISSWYRRKIRLAFNTPLMTADCYLEAVSLGVYRIDDVKTCGAQATIKLVSLDRAWDEVSAESVLDGTEPFRGATISALIKRLIKAADPQADVTGIPDSLTMPLMTSALASSMGPCPNIVTASGEKSAHHWIPRCARLDNFVSTQTVYVGFEVPGANQRSDGAIAKFDVNSAKWTIVVWPTQLDTMVPHLIYPGSGANLYCWVYYDNLDQGEPLGRIQEIRVPKAGGTVEALGEQIPAWQSRYLVRNGVWISPDIVYLGTPWNRGITGWYGEPLMLPYLQVLELLGNRVYPSIVYESSMISWNGYGKNGGDTAAPEWALHVYEPISPGNAAIIFQDIASDEKAMFRFFYAWTWHQPQTRVLSTTMFAYWVGQGISGTSLFKWRIYQQRVSDGANATWTLDGLGDPSNAFFTRQVTAWCLGVYHDTVSTMLLAVIMWDETFDAGGPRWSVCSLYKVTFSGSSGGAATCAAVWTKAPVLGALFVPIIVRLWTPYSISYPFGERPRNWTVAVIMNRAKIVGPVYGLGIWNQTTDAWIELFGESTIGYTGPTSGAPFDGFVIDPNAQNKFHFADQATGQLWQATVNPAAMTVLWSVENDGFPITSSEFALASPDGLSLLAGGLSTQPEIYWWTAPGPHGDTLNGDYVGRSSSAVLYRPGEYNMVRLSTRLSQFVDVADFTGMSVWKALVKLLARALLYDRYIDGDGRLVLEEIDSGATAVPVVFEELVGPAIIQDGEVPAAGLPTKSSRYKAAANTVEVIPWGLQRASVPDPTRITAAGSKFAGNLLAQIVPSQAVNVSVICVSGGDVNDLEPDPADIRVSMKQSAILFAWKTLLPETHGYLVTPCAIIDMTINVGGLTSRGGRIWCGEVEIRVSDRVKVGYGDWIIINGLTAGGVAGNYTTITLNTVIGVNAGIWTDATFEPSQQSSLSNGENGIAALTAPLTTYQTNLTVDDSRAIKRWMILEASYTDIPSEYLYVERVEQDGTITVIRDILARGYREWPAETVLKGYVWTRQQGKLYELGDTGVLFGLTLSADPTLEITEPDNLDLSDKASRTICAGDGAIIRAEGVKLTKLKSGVVKSIDQAALKRDNNQTKSRKVDDNPFIDHVFAHGYAPALLAVLSPVLASLTGVDVPLNAATGPGSRISIDDASLFPGEATAVTFRPTQIRYNLADKRMTLDLVSVSEVTRPSVSSWYNLIWTHIFPDYCYCTWEITDLDPTDGHEDLIGVSWDNTIWILDPETGATLHSYNPGTTTEANAYGFVCCVDMNADGVKEIIWGSHDSYVRCMASDLSSVLWSVRDWYTRNSDHAPTTAEQRFPTGPTAGGEGGGTLYQVGNDGRVLAIRATDGVILNEYNANA